MGATLVVLGMSLGGAWGFPVPVASMEACFAIRDALLGAKGYEAMRAVLRERGVDIELADAMGAVHARYAIGNQINVECAPRD